MTIPRFPSVPRVRHHRAGRTWLLCAVLAYGGALELTLLHSTEHPATAALATWLRDATLVLPWVMLTTLSRWWWRGPGSRPPSARGGRRCGPDAVPWSPAAPWRCSAPGCRPCRHWRPPRRPPPAPGPSRRTWWRSTSRWSTTGSAPGTPRACSTRCAGTSWPSRAAPRQPGNVRLRDGKRPRPLTLRVNVGDCLRVSFQNLLDPTPVDDQPATREAGVHVTGLQLVTNISDDGSFVGANAGATGSLVAPGGSATYTYYAEREGAYVLSSTADNVSGEALTGTLAFGLFGAVNVEPRGSTSYRSQVTRAEMDLATTGTTSTASRGSTTTPRIPRDIRSPASRCSRCSTGTRSCTPT